LFHTLHEPRSWKTISSFQLSELELKCIRVFENVLFKKKKKLEEYTAGEYEKDNDEYKNK